MPWTEGEVIANGYGAFWWEGVIDENVLKLTEVIVVQFFEYIKKKNPLNCLLEVGELHGMWIISE